MGSKVPTLHDTISIEKARVKRRQRRNRLIQGCFCRATQNGRLIFLGFSAAKQPREGPKAKLGSGAAAVIIPGYTLPIDQQKTTRQP